MPTNTMVQNLKHVAAPKQLSPKSQSNYVWMQMYWLLCVPVAKVGKHASTTHYVLLSN